MAFFESFTESIRQKWLEYYQANREWLVLQMDGRSVRTPDGGRRPASSLILGVANAMEGKLGNLMVPFFKLNADEDSIVEVLGLNFDPDIVLNGGTPTEPAMAIAGQEEEVAQLPEFEEAINLDSLDI